MATAKVLADHGGTVVLTGRNEEKGKAAVEHLKRQTGSTVHFYQLDVSDAAAVSDVACRINSEVGQVYGLVANAAAVFPGGAFDLSPEDWRRTMAVTLDGSFYCAQAFGRQMKDVGGSVVLVSSVAASKAIWPPPVVSYSASKAALSHLAAVLGVEWAQHGIRVNAIEPGHIETELTLRAKERRPEMLEKWISDVPQGRLITPEEIGETIGFLLSDLSSSMTASVLTADGGFSRR